uniref:Uncharacterized protein n=1 Tax=Phakopsora pachyrhizi TaxID=170000 RepID=A0A0S1MJZ4_PHAPC
MFYLLRLLLLNLEYSSVASQSSCAVHAVLNSVDSFSV